MAAKPKAGKKAGADASSKNWYADRYQFMKVQRNMLALVTVCALAITLLAVFNVSQLAPLKSVQPFVVQTDKVTGITKVVKPLEKHELTARQALSESFLVQFVQAYESYDYYLYQTNYELVQLMSSEAVFEDYFNNISPEKNPGSPLNRFGRQSRKFVTIKSVSVFLSEDPLKPHTAQVRIRTHVEGRARHGNPDEHLVVWVAFVYDAVPSNDQDRYKNPLGFQVVSYRLDKETS